MLIQQFFACALLVATLTVIGCSSDETAPETNVAITARIDNGALNAVGTKTPSPAGDVVDSVSVTSVRVLVRRLVLHPIAGQDSVDDRVVKAGPFVFLADSTGTKVVATAALPSGAYDKLKFEMHRFSSSEVDLYRNDAAFADFVSGDRYSILISGYLVRNGQQAPFTYRSDITSNVTIPLTAFVVPETGTVSASTTFSTARVFVRNGEYLDPTDPKNESEIDNNLKAAFR